MRNGETRVRGVAARAGGWSARHRWAAVGIWVLFVVLAMGLGSAAGRVDVKDSEEMGGETHTAARIVEDAGIEEPAGEIDSLMTDADVPCLVIDAGADDIDFGFRQSQHVGDLVVTALHAVAETDRPDSFSVAEAGDLEMYMRWLRTPTLTLIRPSPSPSHRTKAQIQPSHQEHRLLLLILFPYHVVSFPLTARSQSISASGYLGLGFVLVCTV